MRQAAAVLLMFVVFPTWVAAGFCDWACHRRTAIASTSGLKENLLHLVMFGQMGIGIAAAALLRINAAVLSLLLVLFVLHELTVYWDLRYSTPRREVGPFEQMVHSFLELLPFTSIALLVVVGWNQALALAGVGGEAADWSFRAKQPALPAAYLVSAFLLSLAFNVAPLLQETWSCLRARAPSSAAPT